MNTVKPQNKVRSWAILTVSRDGVMLALTVKEMLEDVKPEIFTLEKYAVSGKTRIIPGKLSDFWKTAMDRYDVLLCIMASGIVVRGIAPYLGHKSTDPAVLVMDSRGNYVISLLSGHLGGANAAAVMLAKRLGAKPVITTGTDVAGSMAVDVLAQKLGCALVDFNQAKAVTAAILDHEPVTVINEAGLCFDGIVLPANLSLDDKDSGAAATVVITDRAGLKPADKPQVQLIPKTVIVGIGCKKNTAAEEIMKRLAALLKKNNLHLQSVGTLATIGLKAEEPGIREVCGKLHADCQVVPDDFVKMVQSHFEGSDFVEKTTGLRAVSEPCGYVASAFGVCVAPVVKGGGITLSLWKKERE
ncbi:MAG: cobalt-precorrin 5A hydrolase [Eubacteriaceae bacterium]|nr:cobalt-precorrin 5A hydrolase [Eubacteriaceae bacterium]